MEEGRVEDVPENVGQNPMDAVHIVPFLLNKFNYKPLGTQRLCVTSSRYHLSHTSSSSWTDKCRSEQQQQGCV